MGCIRIVHSYSMVMYIELLVQVYIGEEARRINGKSFLKYCAVLMDHWRECLSSCDVLKDQWRECLSHCAVLCTMWFKIIAWVA